jgi:hypothetical protein
MTTVTALPVSLVGNQTTITSVTTTPTNILGNPLPNGRHLLRFIDNGGPTFIGSIDLLIVQNNPAQASNMSSSWFLTDTSNTNWNLAYNNTIFTLTYSSNLLYIIATPTFSNLVIQEFLIPGSYAGTNTYGIDNIQAANPAANSPININSPIILTSTSANSVNLGQKTVTQATNISTSVTINGASGVITTVSATTGGGSTDSFTVNNTAVSSTSVVQANLCDYSGSSLPPVVSVSSVSNGSFVLNITNYGSILNPLNGVLKIAFLIC